ncbi:MAG: general secretion pathway protein GspC [Desulfuromonadales bacterium]|nr:general secretion pathway protein GspC [Desulfuromonadales bacterium]
MSRTVTIINILMGIVVVVLLATIVANSLSRNLSVPLLPKGGKSAAAPAAGATKTADLSYYAPILTNGLFGKSTQGQLSPIVNSGAAAQAAAPVTAPAELLLLGTVTGSFRETFALVRHSAKQEERVFRLGDMVFDAGKLVQVTRDQAFIVVNGKKVELLTPMSPAAAAGQATPAPVQPGSGITSTGAGSYVIDQRALNAALDNIGQAMSDARLLPSQKDGKVEGFRASEVKPSGVFAMIGIKNGDVLLRLNDFPIDSPDKALQSFIALKGQNRLKLDMIRDGRPVTFNYDIR